MAVAWSLPGGIAPIWLAFALPAAFASSRAVAGQSAFGPWIGFAIPLAVYFWRIADLPTAASLWWLHAIGWASGVWMLSTVRKSPAAFPFWAFSLPVLLVAFFSGGQGRGGLMVDWFTQHGIGTDTAHLITLILRKSIHFTFYGTVSLVALWVARTAQAERNVAIRTALLATFALASFDELRQSGYASRTGSFWDVLLDLSGAAVFVGLSTFRARRRAIE